MSIQYILDLSGTAFFSISGAIVANQKPIKVTPDHAINADAVKTIRDGVYSPFRMPCGTTGNNREKICLGLLCLIIFKRSSLREVAGQKIRPATAEICLGLLCLIIFKRSSCARLQVRK